jgi:DNA-binding transcriptional MerR regulator
VQRVRFIKRSQELGFTLAEIAELLKLRAKPRGRSGAVKRLAGKKLQVIDEKIADLQRMREALGQLTAECDGVGPISHCPILTAMEAQP